jgi:hypothetical protein
MSVLQKIIKLVIAYLLISLIVAIIDVVRTFYNVIKQGPDVDIDDLEPVFSIKNYIFFPSIFLYDIIFIIIQKVVDNLKKRF